MTGPIGGNFSVSVWNMGVLFDEYKKGRNRWSRTNTTLDLVRYHYCKLKFWRDENYDYIVSYDLDTPMKTNILTHASCHPNYMLRSRHHKVVKSRKTKRGGRPYVTMKIRPPRLMTNRWFFQRDFCLVNLFLLKATACVLHNPWMRPETYTPCVTVYALKNSYYTNLSITADDNGFQGVDSKTWGKPNAQHFFTPAFHQPWLKMQIQPPNKPFNLANLKTSTNYTNGFENALESQRTSEKKSNYSKIHRCRLQRQH